MRNREDKTNGYREAALCITLDIKKGFMKTS